MKELKQKIEDLVMGDNCPEHSKWVAEKIIEEIIKPLAKEAFEIKQQVINREAERCSFMTSICP